MTSGRGASLISTCDQWSRARHDGTMVEGEDGALALQWLDPVVPYAWAALRRRQREPVTPAGRTADPVRRDRPPLDPARGIAQDRLGRVYRLGATTLDRVAVGSTELGFDPTRLPEEVDVLGQTVEPAAGRPGGGILDGAGLAIDRDDRLFVADRLSKVVHVIDIWSGHLLRTIRVADPDRPDRRPAGLATDGSTVWAALQQPPGIVGFTAWGDPEELPAPSRREELPAGAQPQRLAVLPSGTVVGLWRDPASSGSWLLTGDRHPFELTDAADIVADDDGVVVAPATGATARPQFVRLTPTSASWMRRRPLDAPGYVGGGIVATESGRIGFFSRTGFRLATEGTVRYVPTGTCVTYRLDSGQPLNRWGRVMLEACVPPGTSVRFGAITSDDEATNAVPERPPVMIDCGGTNDSESPPLPPQSSFDSLQLEHGILHRRAFPQTPWWRHPDDEAYDTYEAPVAAPPGRFLWLRIELSGGGNATPRVREVRVERRAHRLMRRLPEVFSREPAAESFLHRYLSMLDSVARDLDVRAVHRDLLVDPRSTPIEMLDWLASFAGLVLDERWAEAARRRLVREAVHLYRRRGTPWALSRYLEIYLAGTDALGDDRLWQRPVVVEHYRLRGLGGPQLTGEGAIGDVGSVVGLGFRVGGEPEPDATPLESEVLDNGGLGSTSHRFSILIPRTLSAEEQSVVHHVLDRERPAHTSYDLCTIDAGMRVGHRLHLGVSTLVGPTGAFAPSIVGSFAVGDDAVLGRPTGATTAGRIVLGSETIR